MREEQPGPAAARDGEVHAVAAAAGARMAVPAAPAQAAQAALQPGAVLPHAAAHQEKILPQPEVAAQPVRAARAPLSRQPRAPLR